MERTIALIKPDAFEQKLVGHIISLIEAEGFRIHDLKMLRKPSVICMQDFYGKHAGKPYFEDLIVFMTSGPIIAMVLERDFAIARWREMIGPSDPTKREPSEIRYLAKDAPRQMENLVHGSDSESAFLREATTLGWYPHVWL